MTEISNIAIAGIINDIFKYDVSLSISHISGIFYVNISWIGETIEGPLAMGNVAGHSEKLFNALSLAYQKMIVE